MHHGHATSWVRAHATTVNLLKLFGYFSQYKWRGDIHYNYQLYRLTCMNCHSTKQYQPDDKHVVTVKDEKRVMADSHAPLNVYTSRMLYHNLQKRRLWAMRGACVFSRVVIFL